jgi:tetratricopeptide (TPR) repeat protein
MQTPPSQTAPADNRSAGEHFEAGKRAQDQGQPSQAMIEYRKALRLDPTLHAAYLNMGNIYYATYEDQERAREMYQQALKFDPANKLGHNNLGVIYLKQNRLDQAEAEFQAAVKKDPNYADAWYNLACIYAKKGQTDQAVEQLKKAARIEPGIGRSAASDPDLVVLRGRPDFERLLKTTSPKTEKD